jgi:histidinol-phosphate aminotransferase
MTKPKGINIKRLVKPAVRGLKAYEASEIPCRVKLDANESPYGFKLKAPKVATNRYPDPEALKLRGALARRMKTALENVLVGNGSDELIYYLVTTFGGPVLFPTPTFVMYGVIATALGEKAIGVPLDENFDIDLPAMLKTIRKEKPKLVFLATPNNPTGNCLDTQSILRIVEATRGIVIVDEAYGPFATEGGMAPLLPDYRNMVLMRTLSKIGLAALRVGYMAGHEEVMAEVNKVRLPFNLNSYSQAYAVEAMKDKRAMRMYIKDIASERDRLMAAMEALDGVEPCPSEANFILFRAEAGAKKIYDGLLKRGVLIRNVDTMIKGCLRVTVGTKKENNAFLKALKETLK